MIHIPINLFTKNNGAYFLSTFIYCVSGGTISCHSLLAIFMHCMHEYGKCENAHEYVCKFVPSEDQFDMGWHTTIRHLD